MQVEAGHVPEPVTRDPVRIFPHRLVPLFEGVAVLAIVLTLGPWLLTFLPQQSAAGDDGPPATMTPYISASAATNFDQGRIVIPADTPVTLTFDNKQDGVPHNVAHRGPRREGRVRVRGRGHHRRGDHRVPAAAAAGGHLHLRLHHPPTDGRHGAGQGRTATAAGTGAILTSTARRRTVGLIAGAAAVVLVAVVLFVPLGWSAAGSLAGRLRPGRRSVARRCWTSRRRPSRCSTSTVGG